MKRIIYLLIVLVMGSINTTFAQRQQRMNREEFKKKQKEFLMEKAGLTREEARQLFPLYFELQNKKQELNRKAWQQIRKGQKNQLSEEEYSQIVNDVIEFRIATDKLELEYIQKYKTFLPASKIYRLQRAEMHFHRNLIKCIQHSCNKQSKDTKRKQ